MNKFDIFKEVGKRVVQDTINELTNTCFYDLCQIDEGDVCEVHHLHQLALSNNGDWSNCVYLSSKRHKQIHRGALNGYTFKTLELMTLEKLGYEVPTTIKELDYMGVSPNKHIHVFVKTVEDDYHTKFIYDDGKNRKPSKEQRSNNAKQYSAYRRAYKNNP